MKKIICPSCGGEFLESSAHCPYCGTMYYPGAENAYMDKMYDVQEDLDKLQNAPKQVAKKELTTQAIVWRAILLGVVGFIVVALVVFTLIRVVTEHRNKKEFLWKLETYAQMNEFYANNDLEQLVEIYMNAEDGYSFSEWKRYDFLEQLLTIRAIKVTWEEEQQGEVRQYQYRYLFEDQLKVIFMEDKEYLTTEEKEKLQPLVQEVREDFDKRWELTEEELEYLYEIMKSKDFRYVPDSELCNSFVERVYKEEN